MIRFVWRLVFVCMVMIWTRLVHQSRLDCYGLSVCVSGVHGYVINRNLGFPREINSQIIWWFFSAKRRREKGGFPGYETFLNQMKAGGVSRKRVGILSDVPARGISK